MFLLCIICQTLTFDCSQPNQIRDLEERGLGSVVKTTAKGASAVVSKIASTARKFAPREEDIEAREFEDEILARELEQRGFGKFIKGAVKGAAKIASNFIREEDLEAREFDEEIEAREIDEELLARELEQRGMGGFGKVGSKLAGGGGGGRKFRAREVDEELLARELEQRGFGKFIKGAVKGAAKIASNFIREEDLEVREFDEEIEAREIDEELLARELEQRGFGKFLKGAVKGAAKIASNFIREEDLEARDVDEIETYVVLLSPSSLTNSPPFSRRREYSLNELD